MAFAAAIGPIISGVASIAGALVSASAMQAQAQAQEEQAKWNADRQREEAARERAAATARSAQEQDKADKLKGKAVAAMAQTGSITTEGAPLLLTQNIEQTGWYNSQVALTEGQAKAKTLDDKASAEEYEGQIKAMGSRAQATGQLLSGFGAFAKGVGASFG